MSCTTKLTLKHWVKSGKYLQSSDMTWTSWRLSTISQNICTSNGANILWNCRKIHILRTENKWISSINFFVSVTNPLSNLAANPMVSPAKRSDSRRLQYNAVRAITCLYWWSDLMPFSVVVRSLSPASKAIRQAYIKTFHHTICSCVIGSDSIFKQPTHRLLFSKDLRQRVNQTFNRCVDNASRCTTGSALNEIFHKSYVIYPISWHILSRGAIDQNIRLQVFHITVSVRYILDHSICKIEFEIFCVRYFHVGWQRIS